MKNDSKGQWVNGIRLLALLMLMTMHAALPMFLTQSPINLLYSMLMTTCIPLFFLTVGALDLPMKGSAFDYIKKKITCFFWPMIIWSVAMLFIQFVRGDISFFEIAQRSIRMFFSASQNSYWVLFSLLGIYLFIPIISKWISTAPLKELLGYSVLWVISLFYPYIMLLAGGNENLGFYTPIFYFSGILGYVVVGYMMSDAKRQLAWITKKNIWVLAAGITLAVLTMITPILLITNIEKIVAMEIHVNLHFDPYLTFSGAFLAVVIFYLFQKYYDRWQWMHGFVSRITPLTLGIYLVHLPIKELIVWKMVVFLPGVVQQSILLPLLNTALTFVLSWGVVTLLKKLRCSKYIIGV